MVGMVESWTGDILLLTGVSFVSKFFACALGGRHA